MPKEWHHHVLQELIHEYAPPKTLLEIHEKQ